MLQLKRKNRKDANLDSFFQLTVHKITPVHPKCTIDTERTQIIADLMDSVQTTKKEYYLKINAFTDIRETLTFGYKRDGLLEKPNLGLNICLKSCSSLDSTIFAHYTLNVNNIIYNDAGYMEPRWLPLQSVDKQDQITAYICISALVLRLVHVMDTPLFSNIVNVSLENLSLRDNDIPGNINLEHNSIRLKVQDLEYIAAHIQQFDIELTYGNVKLKSATVYSENFAEQYFELVTTIPLVHEYLTITLCTNGKVVSTYKKAILDFVISDKKKLVSFNMTDNLTGTLISRFVGLYEVYNNASTNAIFTNKQIESNRALKPIDKTIFNLNIDCFSINNLEFLNGQMVKMKLKWGNGIEETGLIEVSLGQIVLNRRFSLESHFTFVNDNFDALPHPELYLIDNNDVVLYRRVIPINDAHIFYDHSSVFKLPFTSYLMDNRKEGEYVPFVSLKLFFLNCEERVVRKSFNTKPHITKDPCYIIIDLFSLSKRSILNVTNMAILRIKHGNVVKTININRYSSYNWLNTKVVISSYILDGYMAPIYIQFTDDNCNVKASLIDVYPVLHGIPQRCKIDNEIELTLSIRLFTDIEKFKDVLTLHQTIYDDVNGSYETVLNNQVSNKLTKPDCATYRISVNIWKLENFTNEVNRMKLKNPCLFLGILPLLMLNQSVKGYQKHVYVNKYMFPRNHSLQNDVVDSADLPFGNQIELEYNLPSDYRLLPKFHVSFVEKDVTTIDEGFLKQLNENEELHLGSCEIDLFEILVENKIMLFKRLSKLYNAVRNMNLRNKDKIRNIIKHKLGELENDLDFNVGNRCGITKPSIDDSRKIFHRAVCKFLMNTQSKFNKIHVSDIKAKNGYYAIKSRILDKLNNTSVNKYTKLNLTSIKPIKAQKLPTYSSAISQDRNSFTQLGRESFAIKPRALTKYVLNEATMQNSDMFFIQPKFMVVEGSKREIDVPDLNCYYRIGNDKEVDSHYRYILPCSLEESIYLEDYSGWSSYKLNSFRNMDIADIRSKINIIDDRDYNFFNELDAYGIDSKLINLRSDEIFGSYAPNEQIKINLYLIDMLIDDNLLNSGVSMEVKIDDTVAKRIPISELNINQDGAIEILEIVEIETKLDKAKIIQINIVLPDIEFNEDLIISSTSIDIEQRYLGNSWHKLQHKPIETRTLHASKCNSITGQLRLWVDIFSKSNTHRPKKYKLKSPISTDLEARLVLWSLNGYDDETVDKEINEVYIHTELITTGSLYNDNTAVQQTPARFVKSPQQIIDFNYRMVWRFKAGQGSHRLHISTRNVTNNTNLDSYIDITELSKRAINSKKTVSKAIDASGAAIDFDIETLTQPDGAQSTIESNFSFSSSNATIRARLEIVPLNIATSKPVGTGRNHPNVEPYLPEPTKGDYSKTEKIRDIYKEIPKEIKVELATYFFIFLLGFIVILFTVKHMVNFMIY